MSTLLPRLALFSLLAAALVPVAGCKTTSSGLSTAAMSVDFTVHENVDAATAKAEFHGPGGAFVELATSDHVSCNGLEMQKVTVGNAVWYAGVCGKSIVGYKFELRRELQNNDTTAVVVPSIEQFAVTSPARDSTVKITEDITVLWSNQGGKEKMSMTLEGDCMEKYEDSGLEDNGKAILELKDLKPKGDAATCEGKLTATRFKNGTALSKFQSAKTQSYYDDVTKLTIATR